jgi:SAM-dependent methyltransferase
MSFLKSVHPELGVDNFSRLDGTVIFFSFVKAAMKRVGAKRVMDFGAGRGQVFHDRDKPESSLFKLELMDLRTDGAKVWACDIDPAVLAHPASHHQHIIGADAKLPFEDGFFDVIATDVTFEHVTNAQEVAVELMRVLKPGGWLCARTPNKFGYVSLITRLVPNRHHVKALRYILPEREAQDTFPTAFKMNSVGDIKRLFAGHEVLWYRDSAGPSYYFGNRILYALFMGLHKILPNTLATSLCVFVRKRADG